jgi:hypothetical protein
MKVICRVVLGINVLLRPCIAIQHSVVSAIAAPVHQPNMTPAAGQTTQHAACTSAQTLKCKTRDCTLHCGIECGGCSSVRSYVQALDGTTSGMRGCPPRVGGQVVFGVDAGTLQVWDQHSGSCGVCEMKDHAEAVTSTCAVGTVVKTLVSTDRIDRGLGKTERIKRVGGPLLDVTVNDHGKPSGHGEDMFTLSFRFFENKQSRRKRPLLYTSLHGRHKGFFTGTPAEAKMRL